MFFSSDKHRVFALIEVEAAVKIVIVDYCVSSFGGYVVNGGNGVADEIPDARERKTERVDRAFKAFEQVDAHKLADSAFTSAT